jgi:hypothetical protein
MAGTAFDNIAHQIQRAYSDSVYRITKAVLAPVVAAIRDVLTEAVTEAFQQGIRDALSPTELIGEFLFGRRRK